MLGPSLVLVTQYFDKKRGIANGIASAGAGVGGLLFPFFVEYLFEVMTYEGVFIIMGAILLHLCISGYLHRSLADHWRGKGIVLKKRKEVVQENGTFCNLPFYMVHM